jgi:hypothetical protein
MDQSKTRGQINNMPTDQIYFDRENAVPEAMNTIETTALISDYTDEDRLEMLKSQFYVQLETRVSSEESKDAEGTPKLEVDVWVYKFDHQKCQWVKTDINLSRHIKYGLARDQYLYAKEINSLLLLGVKESEQSAYGGFGSSHGFNQSDILKDV